MREATVKKEEEILRVFQETKEMNIKFVSYDGEYPNLCCGTLTLLINGVYVRFGQDNLCDYSSFWTSGAGYFSDDIIGDHSGKRDWLLSEYAEIPEYLTPYSNELIKIFNNNVEPGCCGGCT